MISQRINRKVLSHVLLQNYTHLFTWRDQNPEESFQFKCHTWGEPVSQMVDQMLIDFDGETIQDVQRNINYSLTVSKHLLTYHKQDLIWFQHAMAKMKGIRGAFKD